MLPRQPGKLLGPLRYFTDSVTKAKRLRHLGSFAPVGPHGQADEYAMPGTSGGDRWLLWAPWGVPSWAARGHFKRGAGALDFAEDQPGIGWPGALHRGGRARPREHHARS